MSSTSVPAPRPTALPGWLVPAGLALLAGLGLALASAYWSPPEPALPHSTDPPVRSRRIPEPPPIDGDPGALHAVTEAVEHGTRVVKIQAVRGGDELVVDAETGRLLEARPPRPSGAQIKPVLMAP